MGTMCNARTEAEVRSEVEALRRAGETGEAYVDLLVREVSLLEAYASSIESGGLSGSEKLLREYLGPLDARVVLMIDHLCADPADRDILQMVLPQDHRDFTIKKLVEHEGPDGEGVLAYGRSLVADRQVAQHVVGLSPKNPRVDALVAAIAWLQQYLPLVSPKARADVQALIAWYYWAMNDLGMAWEWAARGLEGTPDHSMSSLVLRACTAGMPPRWALGD